jgi:uncharacterized DUF497 family protein
MAVKIDDLYWKDHILDKIIREHGVSPEEVEEVILEDEPEVVKHGQDRYLIQGQSVTGRYLFILVEKEGKGIFVPITAPNISESEKRTFRKRRTKKGY